MTYPGQDYRVKLLDGVALTAADVYSYILPTTANKELNVQLWNVGTGTPVGVWKFQFCNDAQAEADFWTEQKTATRLGASSTAKWVDISAPATVHGSSLTIGGGVAQNSDVPFVLGLGGYFRAWYDYTSGGSAASLGYVVANGKG
jgi:hypothetical protein